MRYTMVVGLCGLILGCASVGEMLPGKLYSIDDARVLAFEIEVTRGSGKVRAVDPVTSEIYEGTYGAVSQAVGVSGTSSTFVGSKTVTSNTYGSASSNMAAANAVLIGNQGNVLDCTIDIQKGFRPRGIGSCSDKKGKTYRLQF